MPTTTQRPPDYLVGSTSGIVHSQDMPWVSQPGIEGSEIKLLRTIPETGGMVFLLRIQPGVKGPMHKHFASAEYFVLQGNVAVGIEREATYTVTAEMAPGHLPVTVLSTPAMIGLIETTCLAAAQEHLDDGET